ncbi:hypothetical protein GCM10008918_00180 [Lactobacillus kefiranofaciens subsp. kefiranofaciens]|uniref:S-layer protein C-terminal domain-containing protein n=1 Tax=Lactobacillus kefiranofaciens TaxID=267818 RepID=A0ABY0MCH9_9LACO|nr:hypothetical protein SAMN02983011_01541 [Lactobacillus kefiranofaciens]
MAMTNQSSSFLLGTTTTVQAATRKIRLTHNAYIYNHRGHRVEKKSASQARYTYLLLSKEDSW